MIAHGLRKSSLNFPTLINFKIVGRGVMVQSVLPVQPMVQKLVHVFYTGVQSINCKTKVKKILDNRSY